ncbi:spore germination protein KB [Desulfitispora alkaliphila]|uniref:GerAB/ArcD/ProY family transporter n=1 Tax=Desulfitispora alkaliphila TaxID=622674 RepID=UPI003D1CB23D
MSIDGRINARQLAWLVITIQTSVVITLVASIDAGARQDAWISELLGMLLMIFAAYVIITTGLRFQNKSLYQYLPLVYGKVLGTLLGLGYLWFFLFMTATLVRELGEFILTVFIPETPIIVVIGMFVLTCAYGVYMGIETIVRINDILLPVVLLMIFSLWLLVFQEVNFDNLRPVVLETGPIPIIRGGIVVLAGFMLGIAIAVLFPYVEKRALAFPFVTIGLLVKGFIIATTVVFVIGVLGVNQAEMVNFKGLSLVRIISVADFFERLDPLVMLVWVGAFFIKVSVFYYCFVIGVGQILKTEKVTRLVLPAAALIIALSIGSFENFSQLMDFHQRGKVLHNYFFILVIPVTTLFLAIVRNKKEEGGR